LGFFDDFPSFFPASISVGDNELKRFPVFAAPANLRT
jgi:hypothetical protein